MGRSSSAIVLLLVSILAIESHADSPIQNVASIACDDFSNMEYQKICTSLFEQGCSEDSDCDQGSGGGKCCPQLDIFLKETVPPDQTITQCGICVPFNFTCCDVLFIGPPSGGSSCQVAQASCPPNRPHCRPPPKQSASNNVAVFGNLANTPPYTANFNVTIIPFYDTMANWCSSKSPCEAEEGGLCNCGKCSDDNLENPCSLCGGDSCSTFDGNVTTDTAIIGFIALASLLIMASYFLVFWLWKRRDAPFPEPFDLMTNTNRIWRLVTIFNPIYFFNLFIFYGKDFTLVSRVVSILIFQILLGFTIGGMYRSEDEATKDCADDPSENVARVFSVAIIIPVWQYFFNIYVMKPKLVSDESLFNDKGRWFNVSYLSFVFYGLIILGGLITTIIAAVFTGNRDMVIRWAGGLTIMTFIVSPIIGVASGFLLKEFDEKSDVQSINRTSGAGPKSAQPDKLGPPDASNKDVTQGFPVEEDDGWGSQPTQPQASRQRDEPRPPEQNASSRFQRPPPPLEEKTDNPFATSDNPFA